MIYKDYIFSLFGRIAKLDDINKDVDGKGTNERFQELIGEDIDDEILPLIENLLENLITDPDFFPYREEEKGMTITTDVEALRLRLLKYANRYVAIKGTKTLLHLLFGLIGYGATITEYPIIFGFDSPTTFDDVDRTFDMKCYSCSKFDIDLTPLGGTVLTPALFNTIVSILNYGTPINAKLQHFTIEGDPVEQVVTVAEIDGVLSYDNPYDNSLRITYEEGFYKIYSIFGEESYSGTFPNYTFTFK